MDRCDIYATVNFYVFTFTHTNYNNKIVYVGFMQLQVDRDEFDFWPFFRLVFIIFFSDVLLLISIFLLTDREWHLLDTLHSSYSSLLDRCTRKRDERTYTRIYKEWRTKIRRSTSPHSSDNV